MINWSTVKTWRDAGVDAKWGKAHNRPAMFLRPSHSKHYYLLDKHSLEVIQSQVDGGAGLKEAVDTVYAVADIFSIPC
jgi:hypothetical protein